MQQQSPSKSARFGRYVLRGNSLLDPKLERIMFDNIYIYIYIFEKDNMSKETQKYKYNILT